MKEREEKGASWSSPPVGCRSDLAEEVVEDTGDGLRWASGAIASEGVRGGSDKNDGGAVTGLACAIAFEEIECSERSVREEERHKI